MSKPRDLLQEHLDAEKEAVRLKNEQRARDCATEDQLIYISLVLLWLYVIYMAFFF